MAVSFDPKQETNDFGTSNSVFSSVEIRAIISFKVISWYSVTLLLTNQVLNRLSCGTHVMNYQSIPRLVSTAVQFILVLSLCC